MRVAGAGKIPCSTSGSSKLRRRLSPAADDVATSRFLQDLLLNKSSVPPQVGATGRPPPADAEFCVPLQFSSPPQRTGCGSEPSSIVGDNSANGLAPVAPSSSSYVEEDSGPSGPSRKNDAAAFLGSDLRRRGVFFATGGSIAASSQQWAQSVGSDESLAVQLCDEDFHLGRSERLRAYSERSIPELNVHVDKVLAERTRALQQIVDEEALAKFMLQSGQRKVFNTQANKLRWQGVRQQVLRKRLDAETPTWILEALDSWDQSQVSEKEDDELCDADLIYRYVTVRAANINGGKLPSKIPIFKTLHASYSLPSMWRDKY